MEIIGPALAFLKGLWPGKKKDGDRITVTNNPVIVVRTTTIAGEGRTRIGREEIAVLEYEDAPQPRARRPAPIAVRGDLDGDAVEALPDHETIAWSAAAQSDARLKDDEDATVSWTFTEGDGDDAGHR